MNETRKKCGRHAAVGSAYKKIAALLAAAAVFTAAGLTVPALGFSGAPLAAGGAIANEGNIPAVRCLAVNLQADPEKPAISLPDTKYNTVYLNSAFNPMQGVTASDPQDGDLTNRITISGSVDTTKTGNYTLTYDVSDLNNNTAEAKRTISVIADTVGPVITLPGNNEQALASAFDPLAGVTAADAKDGDVSSRIFVTGGVNTVKAGQYTLTYYVTDKAGNKTQATRVITVDAQPASSSSPASSSDHSSSGASSGTSSAAANPSGSSVSAAGSANGQQPGGSSLASAASTASSVKNPNSGDTALPVSEAAVLLVSAAAAVILRKARVR